MRPRPATPLAIAYLISLALLILSTISSPIVASIPLAYIKNDTDHTFTSFGVFGYCNQDGCSPALFKYDIDVPRGSDSSKSFDIPGRTRRDLSSILIVHPIAALLNLVCFAMAAACHFRAASHSPKYLIALLILSFPTLLVTLLAFLVDILVFVPNQAWGCYIVLVATILVMLCSVLTCAMRRTLVSRKARKNRIANDEHMNGANAENLFETTSQPQLVKDSAIAHESQYVRADSPPPLDGSQKSGPNAQYATFESDRSRPSTDDRTPLNRNPSIRTASSGPGRSQRSVTDPNRPPTANPHGDARSGEGRVSPVSPMEFEGASAPPHQQRYYNGPPSRGRGGPPPGYGRGRGGYFQARGGPPRGPPRGGPRGGYRGMPPPRGGGQGQRGPPPNGGWYPGAAAGAGAMGGAAAGAMMMGDRYNNTRGPPRYQDEYPQQDPYSQESPYDQYGYGQQNPYAQPQPQPQQQPYAPQQGYGQQTQYAQPAYGQQQQQQQPSSSYPTQHNYSQPVYPAQAPSQPQPPPLQTQNIAPPPPPPMQPSFNDEAVPYSGAAGIRRTPNSSPAVQSPSSDSSSPAFVNFSGRRPSPGNGTNEPRNPPYEAAAMPAMAQESPSVGQAIEMDATSGSVVGGAVNGADEHTPRRIRRDAAELGGEGSPHKRKGSPHANLMLASHDSQQPLGSNAHPVEIDSAPRESLGRGLASPPHSQPQTGRPRAASDAYYEDVDPRFVQPDPSSTPSPAAPGYLQAPGADPAALARDYSLSSFYSASSSDPMSRTRSPGAASDTSNFTSVSQRGVNPAWQPAPGGGYAAAPARARANEQLGANPDFALQAGAHGHVRGGSAGGSHQYPAM